MMEVRIQYIIDALKRFNEKHFKRITQLKKITVTFVGQNSIEAESMIGEYFELRKFVFWHEWVLKFTQKSNENINLKTSANTYSRWKLNRNLLGKTIYK